MSFISGAMCERCWIELNGEWQDITPDEEGNAREQLVSVRAPVRVKEPEIERCVRCSGPTIWGVYVRWNTDDSPKEEEGGDLLGGA